MYSKNKICQECEGNDALNKVLKNILSHEYGTRNTKNMLVYNLGRHNSAGLA